MGVAIWMQQPWPQSDAYALFCCCLFQVSYRQNKPLVLEYMYIMRQMFLHLKYISQRKKEGHIGLMLSVPFVSPFRFSSCQIVQSSLLDKYLQNSSSFHYIYLSMFKMHLCLNLNEVKGYTALC